MSCIYAESSEQQPDSEGVNDSQNIPPANYASYLSTPIGLATPYRDVEDIALTFPADQRRMLELRLLQHFTMVVSFTFPGGQDERVRDLLNNEAVGLGFAHPFLLNAIFAISSLHISSNSRGGPQFYARDREALSVARVVDGPTVSLGGIDPAAAHRVYLNSAVRQQREAISNISSQNADPIFLSSVMLSYQAANMLPGETELSEYTPPMQWLKMVKAVQAIFLMAQPLLPADSVAGRIVGFWKPGVLDYDGIFRVEWRKPFEALLDWSQYPEPNSNSEIHTVYEKTLSYVGRFYNALLDKEPPRVLLRWFLIFPMIVPPEFLQLVEILRPRALAILAHHISMSKALDAHWWCYGIADRHVNGIASIMPAEWMWAMDWPMKMMKSGFRAS